jgi:branched-subunit amino acid transport protein
MSEVILVICGMAAVTYGPRLFPFLVLSKSTVPKRLDAFLKCIPAAAIGALIIPGVFNATPALPLAAIAGICFTLLFGLLRGGIIVPVLGSVGVAWLVLSYSS